MCVQGIVSSKGKRSTRAFTLVELLVSITILGIIGGLVSVALTGANRQARDTRCKAFVDRLNLLMLQIYEEETERRVGLASGFSTSSTRALSSLMWKRDWLRCALPDRREDIQFAPVQIPYPTGAGGAWLDSPITVPGITSGANASSLRGQEILKYRIYIARSIATTKNVSVANFADLFDKTPSNGEWTSQHQSAECLYMILATHVVDGVPASETLRQRDIGDLDQDGMPEVLDPWGVPVGFMRWPVGLHLSPAWNDPIESPESTTTRANWDELAAIKDRLGRDSLDIIYADPRYLDNSNAAATFPQAEDPFTLYPVIVSAGSDGVFDLYGLDDDSDLDPVGPPVINYTTFGLPNTSPTFVSPPSFPVTMSFVDPFMDGESMSKKLGARVDFNGNKIDDSADNVAPSISF